MSITDQPVKPLESTAPAAEPSFDAEGFWFSAVGLAIGIASWFIPGLFFHLFRVLGVGFGAFGVYAQGQEYLKMRRRRVGAA